MSSEVAVGKVFFNRYTVEKVLGEGGMGAVYLAEDKRIPGKKWAIKELWDFGDPQTQLLVETQFKQEAAILAALSHSNLPRITDFFVEGGKKYLVMDFVEGETLEELLQKRKGPIEIELALRIAEQLIDVMEYLHGQNPPVIFRDLKPANIMLSKEGKIHLIDFGIARIFSAGKSKDTTVLGTPGYAAPEQYGTGQTDQRSDIYAFGATIYFCITGKDPSDDPFRFEQPSKINPKIPQRLENAVLKCVQLKPEERFQSASELRRYLFDVSLRTGDILPDIKGVTPEIEPDKNITIEPESLDFGLVKKGSKLQKKFRIKGNISGAKVTKDQPWLRVYPPLVNGANQEVSVSVYASSLNYGGKYDGEVVVKGKNIEKKVPVHVSVDYKYHSFFSYLLVFIFTIMSLIPLLGYVGFFYNMVAFFSVPPGERKTLKIFFYISIFASIIWTVIGVLWAGIYYLNWFGPFENSPF